MKSFSDADTNLPSLPQHAPRGIAVEKGDRATVTRLAVSVRSAEEVAATDCNAHSRVPPWAHNYPCGATFGLVRPLQPQTFSVDGNRAVITPDGWNLEIAVGTAEKDPLRVAHVFGQRILDVLTAEAYHVSELDDPLREHSTWFRESSATILRIVRTGRLALGAELLIRVHTPTGQLRSQSDIPVHWHASFAYFRRAQLTDSLDDAYRNLFLALEALLSEVYPWRVGMGEASWLNDALERVVAGYQVDLGSFVGGKEGNPLRRFMKAQYRATRCALFHAKLTARPTIPGNIESREALVEATRRLGQLYVHLARHITGAGFGGSSFSRHALEEIARAGARLPMYVSRSREFDISQCVTRPATLTLNVQGQTGVHQLSARWSSHDLPERIRRAGLISDDTDGAWCIVDIDTTGSDEVEFVLREEFVSANGLRDWSF